MQQEPFETGHYYHIFNRGNNKETIFKEEENYFYFLQLVKKYLAETCVIYSYCLLPNHFHFVIRIKDDIDLPEIYKNGKKKIHQAFSNMFNAYTKAINKKYNRTGSLFQEHLKRIKIGSENYLRELILYIHLNPEKHTITNNFSNYNYSSYRAFLSNKPSMLKQDEIICLFDDRDNFIECHKNKKIRLELLKEIEENDY